MQLNALHTPYGWHGLGHCYEPTLRRCMPQSRLFWETHIAVNVIANGMNGGVPMLRGRSGLNC